MQRNIQNIRLMLGQTIDRNINKTPEQAAIDMIKQKANKNLEILDNSQYIFGNDGDIINPDSAINKRNLAPLRPNADGVIKPPFEVGIN